jgi:hypothetical protein
MAAACQRFAVAPRSSSLRAAFHCPKATAVGERRAAVDDRAVGFVICAGIKYRVEDVDVVAAGGPVKRCLAVRAGEPGVDVGSRCDQDADGVLCVGEVAGVVGCDVQQRARLLAAAISPDDPRGRKRGGLVEQSLELGEVSELDRAGDRASEPARLRQASACSTLQ